MIEEWRVIPSFPIYEVSNTGRVRRAITGKKANHRYHAKGYEMPPSAAFRKRTGYNSYHFYTGPGKYATRRGARLVLEAFVGPPPTPEHVAAHNDGVRHNDILPNLRWATLVENSADRYKHGTMKCGTDNKRAKLTDAAAQDIKERYERGEKSTYQLAAIHGVTRATIAKLVLGKSYIYEQDARQEANAHG